MFSLDPSGSDESGIEVREDGGAWTIAYSDGARFAIDAAVDRVRCDWDPPLTADDAATYLLGPVLSMALRLRDVLCLHACVVSMGDGVAAVLGEPEAGKSTLAAALALRGHRVASDDVAPVIESGPAPAVCPTYPRIRLWPDSVARLFGRPDALPLLTPGWDKRFFDLAEPGLFEDRVLPLRALFVLAERSSDPAAPGISPLSPREAFAAVLGNLHTVWMMPSDPQVHVFRFAERIALEVPTFRLTPHVDPDRLGDLCALVEGRMMGTAVGG